MSILSELIRDGERLVKSLVRKNPQLKMIVRGAQITIAAYEQLFPGANLIAKATEFIYKAEQKYEAKVEGFLSGDERRRWVLTELMRIKALKGVTKHDWLNLIQAIVTITPRKLGETAKQ